VGVRFGRLVVVAAVDWTDVDWRAGQFRWLVECDCGSEATVVSGMSLVSGHTRSCGCLAPRDSANARRRDFLPAAPVVPHLLAWHSRHGEQHDRDFSFRQLADRAGTTDRTLRRYVTGEQRSITIASARRLAEALGEPTAAIWGAAQPTNRVGRSGDQGVSATPADMAMTGAERLLRALAERGLSPGARRAAAMLCLALDTPKIRDEAA
jgi:transcriptional regulator with XRE-family HTH domain